MPSFSVNKTGEIHRFLSKDDAENWLIGEGVPYVLFDHFPNEEEYFTSKNSLKFKEYEEDGKVSLLICSKAHSSVSCKGCPHTTKHAEYEGCSLGCFCHEARKKVTCLPCL